jgi:hypothetical protein
MREHKYRAWNGTEMVCPDYITRKGIAYWKEDSLPNASVHIMQYTGIKDSDSTEIYEEDIFIIRGNAYKVEYFAALGKYVLSQEIGIDSKYQIDLTSDTVFLSKVIGNSFQNPKLMDSTK